VHFSPQIFYLNQKKFIIDSGSTSLYIPIMKKILAIYHGHPARLGLHKVTVAGSNTHLTGLRHLANGIYLTSRVIKILGRESLVTDYFST